MAQPQPSTIPRTSIIRAMFPPRPGQWFGPLVAVAGLAIVAAVLVLTSGIVDLSASTPHPQGWAQLLHYTFRRSVGHQAADITVPADFRQTPVIKGAIYYARVCAGCHGGPGLGQNPIALAMRPEPQYLPPLVAGFSDGELFWIVKHGVKYSAMPAWPAADRDDEVWSIVAFLRQMPRFDRGRMAALTTPAPAAAILPAPAPQPVGPRHYAATIIPDLGGTEQRATRPAVGFGAGLAMDRPAQMCVQCHGPDGRGLAGGAIPNLTILDAVTLRQALTAFASGTRHSGFMQPVAVQLTDVQIAQVADYFAALPRKPSPSMTSDAGVVAAGLAIANNGLPAKKVAACQTCHDVSRATAKLYPAIAAQNFYYLRDQMRLFRDGIRHQPGVPQPMATESHRLSDAEIDAVSRYYAALPPQAPRPVETAPGIKAPAPGRVS